jgi:hypothetical protein
VQFGDDFVARENRFVITREQVLDLKSAFAATAGHDD